MLNGERAPDVVSQPLNFWILSTTTCFLEDHRGRVLLGYSIDAFELEVLLAALLFPILQDHERVVRGQCIPIDDYSFVIETTSPSFVVTGQVELNELRFYLEGERLFPLG
mgnify:CR=1 FL=1